VGDGGVCEMKTHAGADVPQHVMKLSIWNLCYEVSGEHFETNLHVICIAVSLSVTIIGA
jgi:hypothetical protein